MALVQLVTVLPATALVQLVTVLPAMALVQLVTVLPATVLVQLVMMLVQARRRAMQRLKMPQAKTRRNPERNHGAG